MCLRLHTATLVTSLIIALTAKADDIKPEEQPVQPDRGAVLFQELCVSCHGADGQGTTDGYEAALAGEETLSDLTSRIELTMPEDDPELCAGEDAKLVASYIYDEFYSYEARIRKGLIAPPRIELTRLTVTQHRNAIADLLLPFSPTPQQASYEEEAGLRGQYFESRGMSKANRLAQTRVDRQVDFNFGTGSPHADITPDQFSIIWTGSLHAPDTGYYEFRVRTENGARLYVNNDPPEERARLRDDSSVAGQAALIDAWVSSGKMRESTARLFLIGGRRYPFRLEFFKYLEDSSSIKLEWKQPKGVWTTLDHNHLSTARSPRTYVVEASFPADDRSRGYEHGGAISREWHVATNEAAVAAADEVVSRLPLLAGVGDDDPDRAARVGEFVTKLATAAFRRPLTEEEHRLFDEIMVADANNLESGVLRSVLLMLKSPHFLYTNLPTAPEDQPYATASLLSFALLDSIPSKSLWEAASKDELKTEEQIKSHAKAMLDDPRARAKMSHFFRHWLEIEQRDLSKDRELFPGFDEAVVSDLRYSLEKFVSQVVWSRRSDYRQLLQADYLVLNGRLRELYEPDWDGERAGENDVTEFRQFVFPDQRRAGVLTHPYLLAAFAYHNDTSPIHRGVFLTRNIVGRALKPPPEAVAFQDQEFADDLTMREKITELTRDAACMSCHSVINPLGFALENYDPVGRWRVSDNEKPVDSKSQYVTADGKTVEFKDAVDIAKFAVESTDAQKAFVKQLFRHLAGQNPTAYGARTIDQQVSEFAEDKFNVKNLMVRIAVTTSSTPPSDQAHQQSHESTQVTP